MSSPSRGLLSVARDAIILLGGGALQAALTFLVFLFLARSIPPAEYAALGAAMAFVAVLTIAGDMGLNYLLVREGAKRPDNVGRAVRDLGRVKLMLLGAATGLTVLFAFALPFRGEERFLIFVYLGSLPLSGAAGYLLTVLNAKRRMGMLVGVQLAERIAFAGLVVALVLAGWGGSGAALAAVVSGSVMLVIAWRASHLVAGEPLWPPSPLSASKPYFLVAVQFGIASLLGTIYARIDVVILALISTPAHLAAYVPAAQLFSIMLMLTGALAQAAFPWLVPQLSRGSLKMASLVAWTVVLAGLGAGFSGLAWYFSGDVFALMFPAPELAAGAPAFALLAWAFVPAIATVPVALALDAVNLQRIHIYNAAAMVSINVVGNLLLVPTMGAIGAAWAAIASWYFGLFVGVPVAIFALARDRRKRLEANALLAGPPSESEIIKEEVRSKEG